MSIEWSHEEMRPEEGRRPKRVMKLVLLSVQKQVAKSTLLGMRRA